MNSETISVQKLFQDRRQYRVPFFQRTYVWNREDQWERLWSDIAEKAEIRVSNDQPSPHFLGAVVLEPQQRHGLIGVETLHIIDGQQRLTTLQYFLNALAIQLREAQQTVLVALVEACLRNANIDTMHQPEIEIFKVWPTFRDRSHYQLAMGARDLNELRERFPHSFTQSANLRKIGIDHPPPLEATYYFAEQIADWIAQDGGEHRTARLAALCEAFLGDLRLVSISLGEDDDAQIIFETLNGHGAQLHATDLIRNFIFMRADREGAVGHELFESLWRQFEGDFWTELQRRGRLLRPRLEWFVQSALQAILADEVEIGRLYAFYRKFALGGGTPLPAAEQLRRLDGHADNYRQLISGIGNDPIARFGQRTTVWDVSTAHPLALRIANSGLPRETKVAMFDDLTSYFVRRAICGLTAKNYNKIFIQMIRNLSGEALTRPALRSALGNLEGDASRWPRDEEFTRAWKNDRIYPGRLDASRTKAVLSEIETAMRSARSEEPLPGALELLDVDHILPESWFEHWPLSDGSLAEPSEADTIVRALIAGAPLTERQQSISHRENAKATIGNLTLAHYGVNRGLHNRGFATKRERFFAESNLHLNRSIMLLNIWDETKISGRGEALLEIALRLWRGPEPGLGSA